MDRSLITLEGMFDINESFLPEANQGSAVLEALR